ncbi:MAG: hypothetical protein IT199_07110 [Solirubrobacterales bacterium]|nr:hypothetical protein [Solirubrobacterales bacterium]
MNSTQCVRRHDCKLHPSSRVTEAP